MYYAIIDAQSAISRLTTVAYGVRLSDITEWFADEFLENYDMQHEDGENADEEKVLRQCKEIKELAEEDALEKGDLEGLSFAVSDISVELYGIYETYEEFAKAFSDFVSDKPKYVKIKPENSPEDILAECDRLNTLLVRASI